MLISSPGLRDRVVRWDSGGTWLELVSLPGTVRRIPEVWTQNRATASLIHSCLNAH